MQLCIHHGAAEIGGNCVELRSGGKSLLLDIGLPLQSEPVAPPVRGLLDQDPDLLGVVLSHPHLDHYGLLPLVRPDLTVWLGQGAICLLEAAAPFTSGSRVPQRLTPYLDRQPFATGPFKITPYLMDHSAFDAFGLLVEADGRRLFYSGDFRGHGRKARVFDAFLAKPPTNIDLLLMEGTTLGRADPPLSEQQVEDRAHVIMRNTPSIVLACFSAQNIDRFVTFFRASVRSGRTFVADAYLANLIKRLGLTSLPDPCSSAAMRVFLPTLQRRAIIEQQRFDLIAPYSRRRIYPAEIARNAGKFSMMFRGSMARDLANLPLDGGAVVYSLWPGYLERDRVDLRAWARGRGLDFQIVHSSGHAHPEDLRRFAEAVNPTRVMPIHTNDPAAFTSLYPRLLTAANGEWVIV